MAPSTLQLAISPKEALAMSFLMLRPHTNWHTVGGKSCLASKMHQRDAWGSNKKNSLFVRRSSRVPMKITLGSKAEKKPSLLEEKNVEQEERDLEDYAPEELPMEPEEDSEWGAPGILHIVCEGLKFNDVPEKDSGIVRLFNFLTPAGRTSFAYHLVNGIPGGVTLEYFLEHASGPALAALGNCVAWRQIGEAQYTPGSIARGAWATILIEVDNVNDDGILVRQRFEVRLEEKNRPPMVDEWFVREFLEVGKAKQVGNAKPQHSTRSFEEKAFKPSQSPRPVEPVKPSQKPRPARRQESTYKDTIGKRLAEESSEHDPKVGASPALSQIKADEDVDQLDQLQDSLFENLQQALDGS